MNKIAPGSIRRINRLKSTIAHLVGPHTRVSNYQWKDDPNFFFFFARITSSSF